MLEQTALSTPTYNNVSQETVKSFPETIPKETLDDGASIKRKPPGGKITTYRKEINPSITATQ